MTAEEIKAKARHEIDTPGHPDYGKPIYTFTEADLNALIREELIKFDMWMIRREGFAGGGIESICTVNEYLNEQQNTQLLPCGEKGCVNLHEKLYRGCDICKFNKSYNKSQQ